MRSQGRTVAVLAPRAVITACPAGSHTNTYGREMRGDGSGPVVVRRVYDPPEDDGRARVLVDRLWPRGVKKQTDAFDEWMPAVAPSPGLRKWYRHEPGLFAEFCRRYREELAEPERRETVERLVELARDAGVVLLTATRDPALSHAAVLAEVLGEELGP
jgi:uncharacterized protein YeaO (DUF488 family)